MSEKEKQLATTIKSLVNVLEMAKIFTPKDINGLIEQHIEITKDILNIVENE